MICDNKSLAAYTQAVQEAKIVAKGTPEEGELLRNLYHQAGDLSGKDWSEFSSRKTTDEGIEESARLLCQYRILMSEIRHRKENSYGQKRSSEKQEY